MRWFDRNHDVKWDNDGTTGVELNRIQVNKLRNGACEIAWSVFSRSSAIAGSFYTGQGGLVQGPDGSIKFLTATHNICSEPNSDGEWEDVSGAIKCFTFNGVPKGFLHIPRGGWERTEEWTKKNAHPLGRTDSDGVELSWKYGVDISLGPEVSRDNPSANEKHLLGILSVKEVVPDNFVYEEGLKLGMVIYATDGPNYENEKIANNKYTEKEIRNSLGGPKEEMIFTGKITRADIDKEHIEHDVNAFGGCSGGHLIVLEKDHEHFGKVAAVHAGSKVEMKDNIGFKVAGIFSKY